MRSSRDVVALVERYCQRLLNPAFQRFTSTAAEVVVSNSNSNSDSNINSNNRAGSTVQGPKEAGTVVTDSKKRICNANGDPYCPLVSFIPQLKLPKSLSLSFFRSGFGQFLFLQHSLVLGKSFSGILNK